MDRGSEFFHVCVFGLIKVTLILLYPNIDRLFFVIFLYYVCRMSGRKPLYDVKRLKIGQKMAMPIELKRFRFQYINNFNGRGEEKYKAIVKGDKLFVERIA